MTNLRRSCCYCEFQHCRSCCSASAQPTRPSPLSMPPVFCHPATAVDTTTAEPCCQGNTNPNFIRRYQPDMQMQSQIASMALRAPPQYAFYELGENSFVQLRKWNERWVILDPTTGKMEYKVRRNEPAVKGTIQFDANSTITISPVNFQRL